MITSPWFVTPTAVRQYAKHIRSNFEEAQRELIRLSFSAEFVRPDKGPMELWMVHSPEPIRMLVSNAMRKEGDKPQLVSVFTNRSRFNG